VTVPLPQRNPSGHAGPLSSNESDRSAVVHAVLLALLLLLSAPLSRGLADESPPNPESPWQSLEPGLDLAGFPASLPAESGDSTIRVLRIDPTRFELRLLNASAAQDGGPQTPKEWAERHALVAVINASMYQEDGRTSVSLMTTTAHTNHPRLSKDNAVLAFDRLGEDVPVVQIIDRTCQDFDQLRTRYGTLVQSIRMISCRGNNVWSVQAKKWSTAAIGIDRQGRVLFIHVQSPYSTHDVANMLLALPIDLQNAMYVEGGPQAQLYVRSRDQEIEVAGVYDNGIMSGDFGRGWPLPNVVGVVRKAQ
jgi:hypothetical protein